MPTNFINISDFSSRQLARLLDRAVSDKALFRQGTLPETCQRKTLAMVFEKPSLRTRVSFETAMTQLGGHAMYLSNADIGIGTREPVKDIARVLGRMCDGIMARTFSHDMVEQLGSFADVPVINALTDHSHPCQAMADLMTVREHFGKVEGKKIAFVGDGNNVARSLTEACSRLGAEFVLACPEGYELERESAGEVPNTTGDPVAAVAEADVIYADTWVSMGQEDEKAKRVRDFEGFQVNEHLLAAAPEHAVVLHCLPAYRGYEITDEVFEKHSRPIFDQSENRLHFQRTLLNCLIAEGGID